MAPNKAPSTQPTYAETLRLQLKTGSNPTGRPITLRQLSRELSYSYEHLRKLVKGEALPSAELNEDICRIAGLDKTRMLATVERERIARRWRRAPAAVRELLPPPDSLNELWSELTSEQKESIRRVAEAFVAKNQHAPFGRDRK